MAITLASLQQNTRKPPRILIYGGEGTGKTTFALCEHAPDGPARKDAVAILTEDGLGDIEAAHFPLCRTYEAVEEAMGALYNEVHDFKTLVIDSLDWLEPLIWDYTCRANNWESIEQPGYGRGYIQCDYTWRRFFEGINALRDDKGMTVIMIAHQQIVTIADPELPEYQSTEIKLHKRAAAIAKEYTDVILHARIKTFVASDTTKAKASKNDAGRQLATTTGQRIVATQPKPGATAKNRYHLPPELPLDWSAFQAAMQTNLKSTTQQPE
mgnify:FL=1